MNWWRRGSYLCAPHYPIRHMDFQLVTEWTHRSCRQAALAYATSGLPVFPLKGKRPLTQHGFYEASTDLDIVRSWWNRWPLANIGIPTGTPTGWWVLDIDARHSGFEALASLISAAHQRAVEEQRLWEPFPLTRTAVTGGGGLHLIWASRDLGFPPKNTEGLAGYAGVDLKVDGGYIVVA